MSRNIVRPGSLGLTLSYQVKTTDAFALGLGIVEYMHLKYSVLLCRFHSLRFYQVGSFRKSARELFAPALRGDKSALAFSISLVRLSTFFADKRR